MNNSTFFLHIPADINCYRSSFITFIFMVYKRRLYLTVKKYIESKKFTGKLSMFK